MLHPSLWVPGWAFTVPRCRCLSPLPPPLPHAAVMVTFELGMIGLARTLQPVPQQVQAWGPPPSAFYPPPGAYYPPPFPYGPWPVQQVGHARGMCMHGAVHGLHDAATAPGVHAIHTQSPPLPSPRMPQPGNGSTAACPARTAAGSPWPAPLRRLTHQHGIRLVRECSTGRAV